MSPPTISKGGVMKSEALHKIAQFEQDTLKDLLSKCTEPQQAFFLRLYPDGVPKDRMAWAIQQCENTIKKNAAKVSP
jgi:hypothetical protein